MPAYVQAGTIYEGAAGGTVSITGCTAGNFLILHATNNTTVDFTYHDTLVNCVDLGGGTTSLDHPASGVIGSPVVANTELWFGRVVANGTCSMRMRLTGGAATITARLYEFSGITAGLTSAAVAEDVTGTEQNTSATVGDELITTTRANSLAVSLLAIKGLRTTTAFTGQTGGTWVERATGQSATMTFQLQTADLPAAVTINSGTFAITSADWGLFGFALTGAIQTILPDADLADGGWTTAPLYSKLNDASDATLITATAS